MTRANFVGKMIYFRLHLLVLVIGNDQTRKTIFHFGPHLVLLARLVEESGRNSKTIDIFLSILLLFIEDEIQ
jgi:hypothetical protein